MQLGFRIYSIPGCPHCRAAESFLRGQDVPVEIVYADQLLLTAIPAALGRKDFEAPIILSYATEEILIGCNYKEMARCVHAFRDSSIGNQLRSQSSEGQQSIQSAAEMATNSGTA